MIKKIIEINNINYESTIAKLNNGRYKLGLEFTESKFIYYNVNSKSSVFNFFNMRPKTIKEKIKFMLVLAVGKPLIIKNSTLKNVGDCVMISRKNELKIFDFHNQLVTTTYQSDTIGYLKRDIEYFQPFYNLTILQIDVNQNVVIERLIEGKGRIDWANEDYNIVISSLVESLVNKCEGYPKERVEYTTINNILSDCRLTENRETYILPDSILAECDREKSWPQIISHGDLNLNNVLLNAGEIFLIDFEEIENKVFFYDFFDVFFMEALSEENFSFISDYFFGVYSKQLATMFESFEIEYEFGERFTYFKVFYISKIKNMQYIVDDGEYLKVSRRYKYCYITIENIFKRSVSSIHTII